MNPGSLVVAVGGFKHPNECKSTWLRSEGVNCTIEHWTAKLYVMASDWSDKQYFEDGAVGMVLCRLRSTGAGREWRRVMVCTHGQILFGWMCPGDGWRAVV
jgi:hypothetical protein